MVASVHKSSRKRKPRATAASLSSTQAKRLTKFLKSIHSDSDPIHLILERGNESFTYVCDDPRHILNDWGRIRRYDNVFFALNPSSKSENMDRRRIARRMKGRTEGTIQRIRVVQIDIDPFRTEEGKLASTGLERHYAKIQTRFIVKYLEAQGWPKPSVLSSGNGYQIYYPCDFRTDFKPRIVQLQKHLLTKFKNDFAAVDKAAARLTQFGRLPYSLNRKGLDTKSRPHRKVVFCKRHINSAGRLSESDFDFLPDPYELPTRKNASPKAEPALKFRPDLVRRAFNYVTTMPEAKGGDWGHDKTYRVACTLAEFGLNKAEALYILRRYNDRCSPPWDEPELRRKWNEAKKNVPNAMMQETELPQFFGFVPDWGVGLHKKILNHINNPKWSTAGIVELFAVTQLRRMSNIVPAEFLRQLFLPAPIPRNWRRDLTPKVPRNWQQLDSHRSPSQYTGCVFCGNAAAKHTHFKLGKPSSKLLQEFWAIEENDKIVLAETLRLKQGKNQRQMWEQLCSTPRAFYALHHPALKGKQDVLFNKRELWLTYWPLLLLGQDEIYLARDFRFPRRVFDR